MRGGSWLGTIRYEKLKDNKGLQEAIVQKLTGAGFDALIVIGGDGSLRGADALSKAAEKLRQGGKLNGRFSVVVVPASIDHGLPATHATVGFDSALNVIVASCDNITDSGQATNRVSIVETMGGRVGALALMGAMAAGAELALTSEDVRSHEDVFASMTRLKRQMETSAPPRRYATIVVKEQLHADYDTARLRGQAEGHFRSLEVRATELGYIQRGGNASYYDRVLGTLMGVESVKALVNPTPNVLGQTKLLRVFRGNIEAVDLHEALAGRLDEALPEKVRPWTDETRLENAKPLWRYKEIRNLFEQISIFSAP